MIRPFACLPAAVLAVLFVFGLSAQDSSLVGGAWYRYLPDQSARFANGHYRLELLAIQPATARSGRLMKVEIYPDARTRTRLRLGTFFVEEGSGPVLELRFHQTRTALALIHESPQGFPVTTWLDIKGLEDVEANERISLQPVLVDGQVDSLRVGRAVYRDLARDLRRHASGGSAADAREFMRLLFVHIYAAESRVKDFGTIAMVGMDMRLPGAGSGSLRIQFQSRGFLGLGNSGVMFYIDDAVDFPRLLLRGEVFGGVYRMEGVIRLYYQPDGGTPEYLGAMDCSQVKLKDGVCNEGEFLIELAGRPGVWQPVPFTHIAQ